MLRWPHIFQLFFLGALVGTVCDGFHSHSGILVYPVEWLPKMAWWVPLLFGSATLVVAYGHLFYDRHFYLPKHSLGWGRVMLGLAGFVGIYAVSAFLPLSNMGKTFVLSGMVLILGILCNRSWITLPAILTALLGCGSEIILTHFNFFHYTHPTFWGIPAWLPCLYIAASIGVGNWARKLSIL